MLGWAWPPALFVLVVWMLSRARRQLRSRSARWLLYPVLAVLAIAAVGGGYETVRESLDARAYPPPGQLVDVGGHRLHLHCTGTGSPTVVLEPGQGGVSSDLAWIAPAVARDTTVCVYDRAGRGWSDATDRPARRCPDRRRPAHAARPGAGSRALRAGRPLLRRPLRPSLRRRSSPTRSPAWCSSTPPHPNPGPTLPTSTSDTVFGRVAALVPAIAHLGAGRLIAQASYGDLPPRVQDEARANASLARNLGSYIDEFVEANTAMQQAATLTNLDGKPLIVLTADTGNDAGWQQKQDHMAALSTNSRHRVAHATTHDSMVSDQADSAAASQAIHDVVEAVRTARPLR